MYIKIPKITVASKFKSAMTSKIVITVTPFWGITVPPFQRQNYIILVEFCKPKAPLKKRGFFIGISFRNAKSLLTCTQ